MKMSVFWDIASISTRLHGAKSQKTVILKYVGSMNGFTGPESSNRVSSDRTDVLQLQKFACLRSLLLNCRKRKTLPS
jgi:hypothetical protein